MTSNRPPGDSLSRHEAFMLRALELAREAQDAGEVPVGALVVTGDRVVATGRNGSIAASDPTAHAEIVALRTAGQATSNYRLTGSTLYVTVEPCLMCVGAIVHARVGAVVYGAEDPKAGAIRSILDVSTLPLNHRFEVVGGVLAEECGTLLRDFFKSRRDRGGA